MPPITKDDKTEIAEIGAWGLAEAIGEATDCAGFQIATAVAKMLREVGGEVKDYDPKAPPNPLFISHGFDDHFSPKSVKYVKHRTYKKAGGAVLGGAGAVGSQVTQVDAAGIMMHSNATGSSLAHLKHLYEISKRYPRSQTIQHWVTSCMRMKQIKSAIRGGELIGAAVPVGAVGISTSIAASLAKVGVRLTYAGTINRVAMELHWRANVEAKLSGLASLGGNSSKPNGPAGAVFFEIFRRRGLTRVFGQYDVPALISESGGWIPLRDKLMLM